MENLDTLKSNAYNASSQVSQLQSDAPSLLTQLKQNLVGIFSKNNPIIQARDAATADYLSTPQRTRADLLPTNMPQIEGRALTLSPTQQDAITASRSAAALVPAAGLNSLITDMYGNIGDAVQGAAGVYDANIRAAQSNASNLMELYKLAIDEENSKRQAASSQGIDLAEILKLISSNLGVDSSQDPDKIAASIYGTPAPATNKAPVQGPAIPKGFFEGDNNQPVSGGSATLRTGGSNPPPSNGLNLGTPNVNNINIRSNPVPFSPLGQLLLRNL